MSYKTHLFICTNAPDKPGKCGSKNSEQMRRNLKERCAKAFGKDGLRVNAAGCLGYCEQGIAAVIYPKGEWFLDLTTSPEDENKLFDAVSNEMGTRK